MRTLGSILALLAAFVLTDSHWVLMQSISWIDMSLRTTPEASVGEMLSGKIQCAHCKAIEQKKNSKQEQQQERFNESRLLAAIPAAPFSLALPDGKKYSPSTSLTWCFQDYIPGIDKPPPQS